MQEKIKLSQLEQFLMRIADQLRKSMDETEYKEYIFGLLFLKRLSDVFEEKREELRKDYKHLPIEVQNEILEEKGTYGETFFVPKRARWNEGWHDDENDKDVPALRDLQESIGPMLNKALTICLAKTPERIIKKMRGIFPAFFFRINIFFIH